MTLSVGGRIAEVAVNHRGAWETAAPELGQQGGIFNKHGLTLGSGLSSIRVGDRNGGLPAATTSQTGITPALSVVLLSGAGRSRIFL
jgi:hypothetical protein